MFVSNHTKINEWPDTPHTPKKIETQRWECEQCNSKVLNVIYVLRSICVMQTNLLEHRSNWHALKASGKHSFTPFCCSETPNNLVNVHPTNMSALNNFESRNECKQRLMTVFLLFVQHGAWFGVRFSKLSVDSLDWYRAGLLSIYLASQIHKLKL